MRRIGTFVLSSCAVIIAMTTACSRPNSGRTLASADTLRVQLQWFHGPQFAGIYAAMAGQIYADSGLTVIVNPGGPNVRPDAVVLSGQADVGIHTADQLLLAGIEGSAIRAIGVVFNRSVAGLALRDTASLLGPQLLAGKRAFVYDNFDTGHILAILEDRFGVRAEHESPGALSAVDLIRRGQADIWGVYVFNEPVELRRAGVAFALLRPDEQGILYYSDTFFSTIATIDSKRDAIRRFLGATAAGWRLASERPDSVIGAMLTLDLGLLRSNQQLYVDKLRALVAPGDVPSYLGEPLGSMGMFMISPSTWVGMCQHLSTIGRLPAETDCTIQHARLVDSVMIR